MMRSTRRNSAKDHLGALMLDGLAHRWPYQYAPTPPLPFVGRTQERAEAQRSLAQSGVVAITGIMGSGKTALATALIQDMGRQVVWIDICPGLNDSIEPFLWQLAQPLAELAPNVWWALHRVQQSQWTYPPIVRLQMILEAYALAEKPLLICVDHLDNIADPALQSLLVDLCEHVLYMQRVQLNLIAIGRVLPHEIQTYALPPLPGLDGGMLTLWSQQLALQLGRDSIDMISQQTDGLPKPVALLFAAIQREPGRVLLDHIMMYPTIRHFANDLLRSLTTAEQNLLAALVAGSASEQLVSHSILWQLESLERQHLVMMEPASDTLRVHPFIQSFLDRYG